MILVVEDNPIIGMQIEMDLEDAGHHPVGPVPRIAPALSLAEERTPRLALVDVDLAGGDSGVDLAQMLFDRHGLRSVYVTGQDGAVDVTEGAAIGVVAKPFGPRTIAETVRAALGWIEDGRPPAQIEGVRWFEAARGSDPHGATPDERPGA